VVPEILCIDAKQPNHDLTVAVEVLRDTNLVSEVKEDIFGGKKWMVMCDTVDGSEIPNNHRLDI